MGRERRNGYEFKRKAKEAIDDKCNKKCVYSSRKTNLERHHLLHIWMAKAYIPEHEQKIIRSELNGVLLETSFHEKLHTQVFDWEESLKELYAAGLYAYLEEEYYKSNPRKKAPECVGNRKLTNNSLEQR